MSECRKWYEGDPVLEEYHDNEWCKVSHDDRFMFEMLCLEGASVGLSWKTVMHKRAAYRAAFHNFEIEKCAEMSDGELENLLADTGLIRNRGKVFSVRSNARAVMNIREEFGSFDRYLWSFTGGVTIDGHWKTPAEIPVRSPESEKMARDMKKRGISYMGPVITYSFMKSIGMVNDHLIDCSYR